MNSSNDIIMSDNVIILKNCSVGLRSWCNTYCLQPYTALFVFVFMAATLHFSFFKGFYTCTPILVGVTSPVSEILLLSKMANFPFQPMSYSPWSSKNLIGRNWLKKIMQVGVDVTYMHINFGGRDLSGFGDIVTFKNSQFSLSTHGL